MNALNLRTTILLLSVALGAAQATAVTYTASLLHPGGYSESYGFGASRATQSGIGYIGSTPHALMWSGTAASAIDLNPVGYSQSVAYGNFGTTVVGFAAPVGSFNHAVLWNGSAASVVDLNPAGFQSSIANAATTAKQVGAAYGTTTNFNNHAFLWGGTAATAVDLNPSGFGTSNATGVSGNIQVGAGTLQSAAASHALMWSGTAASVVDLSPPGFTESRAAAIDGNTQVGSGSFQFAGPSRALLWHGTAASAIDLNPTGFDFSAALGVSGPVQAGWGQRSDGIQRALAWTGSASSYVDLHASLSGLLPNLLLFSSQAKGVSDNGSIVGDAQFINPNTNQSSSYAILWTPVPEPGTAALFACLIAAISLNRTPRREPLLTR